MAGYLAAARKRSNRQSYFIDYLLDFYYLTVVRHLDIRWQGGVDLCMTTDVVTRMDEPRLTGPYPTGKGNSIVECLV